MIYIIPCTSKNYSLGVNCGFFNEEKYSRKCLDLITKVSEAYKKKTID